MKIKDFITEYKIASADNKINVVKKHIVRKYVPYIEKVAACNMIVENSMYKSDEYGKVFQPNSPLQFQMFIGELVHLYTDIEMTSGQDRIEIFDAFEENGVTEVFTEALGAEVVKFNTVLKMCCDDVSFSETDLVRWIERKIQATKLGFDTLIESLKEKYEADEITIDGLKNVLGDIKLS